MKKSDCVIGQYYSWYQKGRSDKPYCIIKYMHFRGDNTVIHGHRLDGARLTNYNDDMGLSLDDRDIQLSTPSEIAWLDACIKANKWVEEPKLKILPIFN